MGGGGGGAQAASSGGICVGRLVITVYQMEDIESFSCLFGLECRAAGVCVLPREDTKALKHLGR